MNLFKKNALPKTPEQDFDGSVADIDARDEIGQSEQASIGYFAQMSSRNLVTQDSTVRNESETNNSSNAPPDRSDQTEMYDLSASFPGYMQPEKIQILGVHVSELLFRVHVMGDPPTRDEGLAFSFWDAQFKCITLDYQALNSAEKSYQDLRFDIGHVITQEYRGLEKKQIMSIGLRKKVVEFDEMTIETMKTMEELSDRSPWPSTAAALLDVQPPLETLMYEERDRHAIQLRYIMVSDLDTLSPQRKRSHAFIRLGPASIDASYEIKSQIPTIISQARSTVLGPPDEIDETSSKPDGPDQDADFRKIDSLMRYKLQLDGGRMRLNPRMELKLPLTTITGNRSSELGFFFETLLERIQFSYGEHDPAHRVLERGLSLQQLASLPDNVRLRLLLFLPDLRPMEQALCVKPEANSFLRCRSVNKGIVKVAKRHARRGKTPRSSGATAAKLASRRQELTSELLTLDDDTLEDLLLTHRRYMRKRG